MLLLAFILLITHLLCSVRRFTWFRHKCTKESEFETNRSIEHHEKCVALVFIAMSILHVGGKL